MDKAPFDEEHVWREGGFARIDKVFEAALEALLRDLADEASKDAR